MTFVPQYSSLQSKHSLSSLSESSPLSVEAFLDLAPIKQLEAIQIVVAVIDWEGLDPAEESREDPLTLPLHRPMFQED